MALEANQPLSAQADVGPLDDAALVAAHLGGDPAALPVLMARYHALVRFGIHKYSGTYVRRDPEWLDVLASAVWTGLLDALERDRGNPPASLKAYLLQIARNQTIGAIRAVDRRARLEARAPLSVQAEPDPAAVVSEFEQILALRECIKHLNSSDQSIYEQMPLIVERRWTEAASALAMPESTLRSRWGRVLESLRACMMAKTGEDFAPETAPRD